MIEIMGYIGIAFFWLTGAVVWFSVFRPIKEAEIIRLTGYDTSNRLNRLRLLWLVLTRPWVFTIVFEFLTMDEYEQAEYLNNLKESENGK